MTKTELDKFKTTLLNKQAELSHAVRNRDDIAIEKTPDAIDEVQLAGERELAIRNLDRESNLLRQRVRSYTSHPCPPYKGESWRASPGRRARPSRRSSR